VVGQSLQVVGGGTVPPGSGWRDVQLVSADRRGGGTSVQAVGGGTSVPPGSGWWDIPPGSDIG
jgi:hypothetical protein